MATMTYREQLLHPNWQRKRLEILQRDEFKCKVCGDDETTLHVHHKRYVKGRMAWEYPEVELITLCSPCHGLHHDEDDAFKELTAMLPVDGPACLANARGLLAGWAHGEQGLDLSAQFQDQPFHYVVGEVANQLASICTIDQLLDLNAALRARDRYTARAAIRELVRDLPGRPVAPPLKESL